MDMVSGQDVLVDHTPMCSSSHQKHQTLKPLLLLWADIATEDGGVVDVDLIFEASGLPDLSPADSKHLANV